MSFLQGSFDLFRGCRVSHMGSYQYVDHAGRRNGKSMSGAKLWAELELASLTPNAENLFNAEELLLERVAKNINQYLPSGTSLLELGPGTSNAFKKKTLPIIRALGSEKCILVDESNAFLKAISSDQALNDVDTSFIEDDFLEDNYCYYPNEEGEALVCLFGSTIGNILSPRSDDLPSAALVSTLRQLSQTIGRGWLLISMDSNQDGAAVKEFYERQSLFQLNVFYRMAVELPLSAGFDPAAFGYEAQWNSHSGQLAHMAIANRDMRFKLGNQEIVLHEGQRLHLKNSYKFKPEFFEHCCALANLEIMHSWSDSSGSQVYLMKKLESIMPVQVPNFQAA